MRQSTPRVKRKISTSVKTTVKVSQKITFVKCLVAGTLIILLAAGGVFVYLNIGDSEQAAAGNLPGGAAKSAGATQSLFDLSLLSIDEMEALTNRDFAYDTTRKNYTSVKWDFNNSLSYLTLEVTNNKSEYSLEIFDQNGYRVVHFVNITDEKFLLDKIDLIPNQEYSYVVKNTTGELYAGLLKFN